MAKKAKSAEKKPQSLTDRTAYLRGLADGMGIDKSKNENSLMLQMLEVMDEMAQKLSALDADVADLEEYVEDMDEDLADMEEVIFCDDDDEYDDDDDDDGEELDEDEALSFDCPSCGKTVMIQASDIDFDESPVCQYCGNPFFTDVEDEDEDPKDE